MKTEILLRDLDKPVLYWINFYLSYRTVFASMSFRPHESVFIVFIVQKSMA